MKVRIGGRRRVARRVLASRSDFDLPRGTALPGESGTARRAQMAGNASSSHGCVKQVGGDDQLKWCRVASPILLKIDYTFFNNCRRTNCRYSVILWEICLERNYQQVFYVSAYAGGILLLHAKRHRFTQVPVIGQHREALIGIRAIPGTDSNLHLECDFPRSISHQSFLCGSFNIASCRIFTSY